METFIETLTLITILGFVGAILMLIAFILNVYDYVDDDNPYYLLMNFVGGALAFYSAYDIKAYQFMLIEGVWTLVSISGLYIYIIRDFLKLKK